MKRTTIVILMFAALWMACSKKKPETPMSNPDVIMEARTADRLLTQKRCTDAIAAYQAILKKFPKDADARNKLGLSYLCDNNPELAIPEFQEVSAANPTFTDVHNNLGVAYMMLQNYPEAQKEFRSALQDPSYPVTGPYYNLARLAYLQDSYEESRALSKKVMELLPKEPGPRLIYSMSLDKLGREDEAILSFQELLKNSPDNLEGNYYLAEVYMEKNQPCEARIYYSKAIDIDPIGELGQKAIASVKTIQCPKK